MPHILTTEGGLEGLGVWGLEFRGFSRNAGLADFGRVQDGVSITCANCAWIL